MMMKYITYLFLSALLLVAACKKAENPVAPAATPVTGGIRGVVTEAGSAAVISQVYITTKNSSSAVTTDAKGAYSIENMKPGTYILTAAKQGYDTSTVSITVDAGIITKADFILKKTPVLQPGTIIGRVLDASDDAGIYSANVVTSPYTGSTSTDTRGSFQFESVRAGKYEVTVSKFGYSSKTMSVTVNSNEVTLIEFVLEPLYGTIKGRVTDAVTNQPIAGVNIKSTPPTSSVTTDSTGSYTIKDVPKLTASGAKYTLTATKADYTTATVDITVIPGKITAGDISMTKK